MNIKTKAVKKEKKTKILLLIFNFLLIVITIFTAFIYSRSIWKTQEEIKKDDFIKTVESMKQISLNYIASEKGYVKNWANYISENKMTLEEAMSFLRKINTDKNRFAHILDKNTYEAYSSYYPQGKDKITTYKTYVKTDIENEEPFSRLLKDIISGKADEYTLLGKYRLVEEQIVVVSVTADITLFTEEGPKDYLLLRLIPTDELKKSWVFPVDYVSAEVGIINRFGEYVIQSPSMKSKSFTSYIRGYNFQDDYNKVNELSQQILNTENGILNYKNFRGVDCVWYYSSFMPNSSLDILGFINADELKASIDGWFIVIYVCIVLAILIGIDGLYLIDINRKLRENVRVAERANMAKTKFLSAMSHDIRTPLNAVLGMMMIAKKKSDDKKAVEDCMNKGISSGKQLITLINDVLDISKIESGNVMLNVGTVSLDEVIGDLKQMIEQNVVQKKLTLECDFSSLPYKNIRADKSRLIQIYVNLLTNAIKYTNEGGKIFLSMKELSVSEKNDFTRLVFNVTDTGIGMSEDFQKKMYSMFSREVKTQLNGIQGTGLGLSIVKQMVDLMNGTIECRSAPGKGTSFTVKIDFPVVDDEIESNGENVFDQKFDDLHVLVAEDNNLNWEIYKELVSEYGVTCDRAENGKKCIEMLSSAPHGTYAAIFMDVHMPVMDGLEATKAIRNLEDENLSNIPIFAMTADAFAEDVQLCLNSGMNGHIEKPLNIGKLLSILSRIKLMEDLKKKISAQEM